MDKTDLTWREKAATLDITARIAVVMFLAIAAFAELLVAAHG